MLAEHMIQLEARKPSANRLREWRIELGRDLFGAWTVDVRFGRIGSRGRLLRHSFASEAEVRAFVRRTLRRRASAPVRIGVAYRCVRASPEMQVLLTRLGIEPSTEFQERVASHSKNSACIIDIIA
jgi:predicted DNA-binding WGR domain protein